MRGACTQFLGANGISGASTDRKLDTDAFSDRVFKDLNRRSASTIWFTLRLPFETYSKCLLFRNIPLFFGVFLQILLDLSISSIKARMFVSNFDWDYYIPLKIIVMIII